MKRIYLASPYTHKDKAIRVRRYNEACKACARLLGEGNLVFSPIAHSHPLARHDLPLEFDFWREWCLSFIQHWATDFYILTLDGWKESRGINAERNQAVICGLPFTFVEAE